MLKKRTSGRSLAGDLLHHFESVGSLDLITISFAFALVDERTLIAFRRGAIAAGLQIVLNPIGRGRAAYEIKAHFVQIEKDGVADHISVRRACDKLLGLIDFKVLKGIDSQFRKQFERVRPFNVEVGHVVGLVEKSAGFTPGALLISPVGELVTHHRAGIGADLRVAQQFNRARDGLQHVGQTLITHSYSNGSSL